MDQAEQVMALEKRLREIEVEKKRLISELKNLAVGLPLVERPLLGEAFSTGSPASTEEKLRLFIELFVTRQDIHPKFWINSKNGKTGYAPSCSNDWVRGVCEKYNQVKCSDCKSQAFLPLDAGAIRRHLEGKEALGVYAIDRNDQCKFLAADFDGDGFKELAIAYKKSAKSLGVDVALEISKSGNGSHAWIFFNEDVPAYLARQLGTVLMSHVSMVSPTLDLSAYDRFFPNQDTLPKGGFGNLIALPLQKQYRDNGRSIFVDEAFQPEREQWTYLSQIKRLSLENLREALLLSLSRISLPAGMDGIERDLQIAEHSLYPKTNLPDYLDSKDVIDISITKHLEIDIANIPSRFVKELKKLCTLANPEFFQKQKMRYSTWQTPRYIFAGEMHAPSTLCLPRGILDKVTDLISERGGNTLIRDQRPNFKKICFKFLGELQSSQKIAVKEMMETETGVLVAPPGSGKTVMACAIIAKRKLPTLVLVHRAQLMDQWIDRTGQFLGRDKKSIGKISGSKNKLTGKLDIAMIPSLTNLQDLDEFFSQYGMIVIDECHHIPASTFEYVLKQAQAKCILGLTATPYRKDGLQRLLFLQAGPVRYELKASDSVPIRRRAIIRNTGFQIPEGGSVRPEVHEVMDFLSKDMDRTLSIANDIKAAIQNGRVPIVISERKNHLDLINEELQKTQSIFTLLLTGDNSAKERRTLLERFSSLVDEAKPACLLTTGSLIGEGFDLPRLDTLFLTMPISFKGRLVQYAGRLHRSHEKKNEVQIYDYVDQSMALTKSMFNKRAAAYKSMDYTLERSF